MPAPQFPPLLDTPESALRPFIILPDAEPCQADEKFSDSLWLLSEFKRDRCGIRAVLFAEFFHFNMDCE